jgi:hypothetical protein
MIFLKDRAAQSELGLRVIVNGSGPQVVRRSNGPERATTAIGNSSSNQSL